MKLSISIATFLLAGAGAAGVGAIAPLESPFQGSDTLFNVTRDAIQALHDLGLDIGPATTYVGGGSGNGQSALVGGSQHIAPMSRMINSGAGVCAKDTSQASGIVIGLDGVDVFASLEQGANPATCNSAGNGLAFDGTNGQGFANYKNVLALVYGGKDNVAGTVDCNSAKRQAVVNNWSSIFENSCANGEAACSNAAHGAGPAKLWHAFRRDDASGTSDVFASILGITPNTSASSLNGFGASPYCNALNWDTTTANANCLAGAGKQYIGPGGVPQGFCSITTTKPCVIGSAIAAQQCGPTDGTCGPLAGDNHRRPPLNTWGDDPDPNTNPRGENDADVLPTSFQDNDPIRRSCIGTSVYSILRDGEEVCNRDGTLGVVVPVPALDFIGNIPDPTHAGAKLAMYSMNACNTYFLGTATKVLSCAPRNGNAHQGQCPNGDATFGAAHVCEVPVDSINNTSQCQELKAQKPGIQTRVTAVNAADNRVYNVHMRDGTTADGSIGYVHETIPTATATLSLDFAGGFARIHQVNTIPAAGAGHTAGCTLKDATDQIGCFTHADRCSIGYAGDGATTYSQRYANGTCVNGAQCSTNGNPCAYFGAAAAGNCTVQTQFPAATDVGALLVNKVAPSAATIQLLGAGAVEYPLARKLYLNSLNFHQGVDPAGNATDAGFEAGITEAELNLAKFESTVGDDAGPPPNGIAPILVNDGFFTVGPSSPTGADTPFCEDFNATIVCDAGIVNDNACFRNPPQWVPTDPSSDPTAATKSTVCGNGAVELFEECDPAAPPAQWNCSVPGATTCSATCRC